MKLGYVLFALVLSITGCASTQIDTHANEQIAQIRADRTDMIMLPECGTGVVIGSDCGLLTQRVAMPDFRETFRTMKCVGDTADVCQTKLDNAVGAWLEQRYTLADFRSVDVMCDANPGKCDDPKEYELALLRSHNSTAMDVAQRRENEVEDQREVAHAIDNAQTTDAMLIGAVVVGSVALHARPYRHFHY